MGAFRRKYTMKCTGRLVVALLVCISLITSCSTLEKASKHGFDDGFYKWKSANGQTENVYLDVSENKIDAYDTTALTSEKNRLISVDLDALDSPLENPLVFRKKSLDVDITSILLKYRPSIHNLPSQLTADFNLALYAGCRIDTYRIKNSKDPLGNRRGEIGNFGFDIGLFAGPGTTQISPFTTNMASDLEYSGMIFQSGIAGFIETGVASFGLAAGYDYLLNDDRRRWIYQNKPWFGFVVGIALN